MIGFVGVDVGGTKSAAVVIDSGGATIGSDWMEPAGSRPGVLLDTVLASIDRVTARAGVGLGPIGGLGIAVAGLVSGDHSTVVQSPVIGERHLELGTRLSTRLGRPVTVENDANATLYGLAHDAFPTGKRSLAEVPVALLLTLGTGVGGAIMVGRHIVGGEHGFASELGHVTVDFSDERRCVCGNRGCIEQFASGRGVAELAAVMAPPPASAMTLARLGATPPYSARDIVAAARGDDPWATSLLRRSGAMLGRAVSILSVVLDPTTVTIGGSFGHAAAPWLLPAAVEEMERRWTYAADRPLPELAVDSVGPYAAARGAALLAAARFGRDGTP